ncbi:MAG: ABC transporter ATP-binding protein [Candidatus Riflebacteria bacterium]|nr:ABC transporter ATP-binding protein [Candidatus Riflebacteria bacterium]
MNSLLRIAGYFRSYRTHFLSSIFLNLIVAICTIYPAWIMKSVVNDVLINRNIKMLHTIALSLIVIMAIKGVAAFGQSYLMMLAAQSILRDIRTAAFDRLQSLSLAFFEKQKTGQIMSRITNDVLVLQNLIITFTDTIGHTVALCGFCCYIFYLHWKLAFISVIIVPFIGAILNKFSGKMKKIGARMQNRIGDISTVLQEFIVGVKAVKSFTLENYIRERFEHANQENFKENMRGNKINSLTSPVIEFINTVGLSIIFWYGGYEVINNRLDAGQLISFLTALVGLFTPIKNLSRVSNVVSQSIGAGDRVFELLDTPVEIREKDNPIELNECKGAVEFDKVIFSYSNDEIVLNEINLKVAPGEIIALVGPSGAGKSTFANLIPRFFDINSGAIKVDGIDIRDLSLNSLRKKIGMVHQETLLFSGTIADNIKLGNLNASDNDVIAAAKLSNADDFIQALPQGYQTVLGERGVNLSGGQAQRIALARAFLKNPSILILDEATSALDSETENLIKESLAKLMLNRTTFMIAHRLSTVVNAHKIVVLNHGKIVEYGTHSDLLIKKGLYSNLYDAQYASFAIAQ